MRAEQEAAKPVNKGGRPAKYPWRDMQVGDSFFAPGRTTHSMHSCAAAYRPLRFRCKEIIIKGVHGTRVWRIE